MSNTEKHLEVVLLNPAAFIKANNLKEITNPSSFIRVGVPTSDGLFSNEIFGITKDQRSNTFAYIDLGEEFLHPYIFKIWNSIDSKIREIVHGIHNFVIAPDGSFQYDEENGSSGVSFIKKNLDKIRVKQSDSTIRKMQIAVIEKYIKIPSTMFIKQCTVIPAYYRDVNNENGRVGIGEVNELYRSLLVAARALKESADFGLNLNDATRGRVQELLLQIYDWFGSGTTIGGEPTSGNLPGKLGLIRRASLSKTTDLASRLVLSSPETKAERLEDLEVDLDYSLVSLASICVNFKPHMVFYIRQYFENESAGKHPYTNANGEVSYASVKDYQIEFSDERITKELDRFIKGYSNRFIPISIPLDNGKTVYMRFKGRNVETPGTATKKEEVRRRLTWCDLFFRAANEVVGNKCVLINRYPVDTYFNQFATRVRVSSTKETEPIIMDNTIYPHYPKIREEDIGTNTSNKFIDTLNISNLYLPGIGGDYDGDQVTVKGIYTDEANEELLKFMDSKANLITLGCSGIRNSGNEAIQALYNLTLCLPDDKSKISTPVF